MKFKSFVNDFIIHMLRSIIFILNSNHISLTLLENKYFNMVLEFGLMRGFEFESTLFYLTHHMRV